jgi:hypothetical protein
MTLSEQLAIAAILTPPIVAGVVSIVKLGTKHEKHDQRIQALEKATAEHELQIDGLQKMDGRLIRIETLLEQLLKSLPFFASRSEK